MRGDRAHSEALTALLRDVMREQVGSCVVGRPATADDRAPHRTDHHRRGTSDRNAWHAARSRFNEQRGLGRCCRSPGASSNAGGHVWSTGLVPPPSCRCRSGGCGIALGDLDLDLHFGIKSPNYQL
jgi:hypothetical protein